MYDKQTQEIMVNDLSFSILAIKHKLTSSFTDDVTEEQIINFMSSNLDNSDIDLLSDKSFTYICKYIKIVLNSFESKVPIDSRCRVFNGDVLKSLITSLLLSNELLVSKSKAVSIDLRPLLSGKIVDFLEKNFKDECKDLHRMITRLYCN